VVRIETIATDKGRQHSEIGLVFPSIETITTDKGRQHSEIGLVFPRIETITTDQPKDNNIVKLNLFFQALNLQQTRQRTTT